MEHRDVVSHAECLKTHEHLGGKIDGCQEFKATGPGLNCSICGCHMNFHKRVREYVTEDLYTECHKIHSINGFNTKDGCKKFDSDISGRYCIACRCSKSFHRNEGIKEVIPAELANAGRVKKERF